MEPKRPSILGNSKRWRGKKINNYEYWRNQEYRIKNPVVIVAVLQRGGEDSEKCTRLMPFKNAASLVCGQQKSNCRWSGRVKMEMTQKVWR